MVHIMVIDSLDGVGGFSLTTETFQSGSLELTQTLELFTVNLGDIRMQKAHP